jgi:hypothetical protein
MRTVWRLAITIVLTLGSLLVIVASPGVAPAGSTAPKVPFKIADFRSASTFTGISCLSGEDCVSVGSSYFSGTRTYVQVWNGSQWLAVPSANEDVPTANELNAVSCTDPSFCMTVGSYSVGGESPSHQTLAETWDGTQWSIVATPDGTSPSNDLSAVSCTGPSFCVAVGYDAANPESEFPDSGLIEMWDGSNWTLESGSDPIGAVLNGVTCLGSTGSDCVAVGDTPTSSGSSESLVMSWDGTSWSVVSSPNPDSGFNVLNGVSCTGPSDCSAVGYGTGNLSALIETWNGSTWSVGRGASGTADVRLDGISCDSSEAGTGCLAVGNTELGAGDTTPYAELWNGSSWSNVSTTSFFVGSFFASAACASPTSCIAVGYWGPKTLAATLSGSSLSRMPTPNQPYIAGVHPHGAAPGTTVKVVGRQLEMATSVTFNGVAGTITVDTKKEIEVTVPAAATSGNIVVTTPGGMATSPSAFDVT